VKTVPAGDRKRRLVRVQKRALPDQRLTVLRPYLLRLPPSALLFVLGVASAAAQAPLRRDVRWCAGGDVTLGTNLDTAWVLGRRYGDQRVRALPDPAVVLLPLQPMLGDANVILFNVEGAIGEGWAPRKCARRSTLCFALRQPPGTEFALRRLNDSAQVIGNLANNHAHDGGDEGFAQTLQRLGAAGVLVAGADTLATGVPVGDGDTIAVLGFSPWTIARVTDLDAVRRHVARAAERYGRVVVTMHIGAEGPRARHTADRVERFAGENRGNSVAFARAAVAGGASLVIGHGPHVLRAAEWDGRALVAYSLGNLVTYGPFTHKGFTDHGAVLCATIAPDGSVRDAMLRATKQRSPGIVEADPDNAGIQEVIELTRRDFPRTGAHILPSGEISRERP
jgi:hypothetical protein